MNLDIGTVLLTTLVILFALALFSWTLALSSRTSRWRLDWAWGNTVLLLGIGLALTQGHWSPWLSIVLANGLVILGYHLLETGLRRFAGCPLPVWQAWAFAVFFAASFLVFTFIWDLYQVRVLVYTVLVAGVWVRILFILPLLNEAKRHPMLVRAFWFLCALILVSHIGRAVFVLVLPVNSLLSPNASLAIMVLVITVVTTAWSLGFVTLDILRNQGQLETALETRDRMLQLIAHDLRGPLGGQVGLLELMQEAGKCREEEESREMLGLLVASAQNSFDLLENLLDWGQSQKGAVVLKPELLRARDLLLEAAEPYTASARAKGLQLEFDATGGDQVWTDRRTVATILRNLVSNAVKFTPAGGVIRLSFWKKEGRPQFTVSDSGPGLTPQQQERLNSGNTLTSTPGTEKEHGSGLGLALCRDFARLNGAELRFSGSPQGTTATLTLKENP